MKWGLGVVTTLLKPVYEAQDFVPAHARSALYNESQPNCCAAWLVRWNDPKRRSSRDIAATS